MRTEARYGAPDKDTRAGTLIVRLVVAVTLISPSRAFETVSRDRRVPRDYAILINNHFLTQRGKCDDSGQLPPLDVIDAPTNGTLCYKVVSQSVPMITDYYDGAPARKIQTPNCTGKLGRSKGVYYIPDRSFTGHDSARYIENKHKIVYQFKFMVLETAFHPDAATEIGAFQERYRSRRGQAIPECSVLVS